MIQRQPLRRTGRIAAKIRRDCRICGKRVERNLPGEGGWSHVRAQMSTHQPDPYPTKRTPKKTSRRIVADTLWAKLIKGDAPCARCGRSAEAVVAAGLRMEAAHGVGRGKSFNVRWHPKNGISLCGPVGWATCHDWYDRRADDLARAQFTISVIGQEAYDEITRMRNEPWDKDIEAAITRLRGVA